MSKSRRKFRDDELDDDYYNENRNRNELKERRKMKRIRNALKTKNINELMDYNEF
jgi:hypothetical protein